MKRYLAIAGTLATLVFAGCGLERDPVVGSNPPRYYVEDTDGATGQQEINGVCAYYNLRGPIKVEYVKDKTWAAIVTCKAAR